MRPCFTHFSCLLALLGLLTPVSSALSQGAEAQSETAPEVATPAEPAEAPVAAQAPLAQEKPAAPSTQEPEDAFAKLEGEFGSVLDELIQARTRAAVLTKALFRTPITVHLIRRAGSQRLSHITLRLDGVPVHDSDGAALATTGDAVLFEGFAAPGMHELALEITEEAQENAAYRYVRSERFRLEVKKDTHTQVELLVKDSSNMAEKLPRKNKGSYDVRTLLRVRAEKVTKD